MANRIGHILFHNQHLAVVSIQTKKWRWLSSSLESTNHFVHFGGICLYLIISAISGDNLLLSFLRGSKFSLERTKEKIDFFHTYKTLVPELFSSRDPFSPEMQRILDEG